MKKEARKVRHIRMRDDEWEKLLRLGGPEWLRGVVKDAKEPRPITIE